MSTVILGIDVGFAAVGTALVELLPCGERVIAVGTIVTVKSAAKRGIRVADDDVHRCRHIVATLLAMIDGARVVAICAELPSGSKGARAAAALGMAKAIVASVAEARHLPIASCTPGELKQAVAGAKNASKADVRHALERRYAWGEGRWNWPKNKTDHEHAADALGAVATCLTSDVIRAFRRGAAA